MPRFRKLIAGKATLTYCRLASSRLVQKVLEKRSIALFLKFIRFTRRKYIKMQSVYARQYVEASEIWRYVV